MPMPPDGVADATGRGAPNGDCPGIAADAAHPARPDVDARGQVRRATMRRVCRSAVWCVVGRRTDHARWRWRRWLVRHLDDRLDLGLRSRARCWRCLDYVDDFRRGSRGTTSSSTGRASSTSGVATRRRRRTPLALAAASAGAGVAAGFSGWCATSAGWRRRRLLLAMALLTFPADAHARHLVVR